MDLSPGDGYGDILIRVNDVLIAGIGVFAVALHGESMYFDVRSPKVNFVSVSHLKTNSGHLHIQETPMWG